MSQVELTQERWNMILDMKDQNKRQQDEIDRLRRVVRVLNNKVEKLEKKGLANDIFGSGSF